ncbi:MAG TPA: helix-turn-helix domain-containing protein [Isosphaeraceae bacterium]|nr:helix-turn-helix domain-containing protein [Isosphaeraceae bacterium]
MNPSASPEAAPTNVAAALPKLAFRPKELEQALGVDERTIQRWRSAGRFPKPDVQIGRTLLWRAETVRDWLAQQAAGRGGRV